MTDKGRCLKTPVKCSQAALWLYPAARVLWFGSHVVVKEGFYGSWVQHAAGVAAVTSQLCVAVVSCCSGSMVWQLLYWLGSWVGVLACASERTGRCGKSPTNSTRNLTSLCRTKMGE